MQAIPIDLKEIFSYNPESGELVWLSRPCNQFKTKAAWRTWNTTYVGSVAGYRSFDSKNNRKQCIYVMLQGKNLKAHRIIWEIVHGPIPKGMVIDHINRDVYDNRLQNLRIATVTQNLWNLVRREGAVKGSCLRPWGRYSAQITANKVTKHLGHFDTAEEAHAAYCEAAKKLHGEFARFV